MGQNTLLAPFGKSLDWYNFLESNLEKYIKTHKCAEALI